MKLKSIFKSKYSIWSVGIFSTLIILWIILPKVFNISFFIKSVITISVLILFITIIAYEKWRYKNKGEKLFASLNVNNHSKNITIDILRENIHKAVATLKTSELSVKYRGKAALYALPWVIVLGAPAAGKSSLLRYSGLNFPLATQNELKFKGINGTKNCDWWFANEGVLLDTAGRYTTDVNDKQEWLEFLKLLKKYRAKPPINAIVVVVSMAEFFQENSDAIETQCHLIREKINEIYSYTGFVIPVHIVISKCDLLPGFREYFKNCNDIERTQMFGIELDNHDHLLEDFNVKRKEMIEKLKSHRIHKIAQTRKNIEKAIIFQFPNSFELLSQKLMSMVEKIINDNPYQETPTLQGIYFTSSLQQGAVIKNIFMHLGVNLEENNADLNAPVLKSYFIENTIKAAIFQYKDSINLAKARIKYLWKLKIFLTTSICLFLSVYIFVYVNSYFANVMLINEGKGILLAVKNNGRSINNIISIYDYYEKLLSYQNHTPWRYYLLYKMNVVAPLYYQQLMMQMQKIFFKPTKEFLEVNLMQFNKQWQEGTNGHEQLRGKYFMYLQAYLTLFFSKHNDKTFAKYIFLPIWYDSVNKEDVLIDDKLVDVVDFYLKNKSPNVMEYPNQILIQQAHNNLSLPNNEKNIYAFLETLLNQRLGLTNINILSNSQTHVIDSQMEFSRMYTLSSWHEIVMPMIKYLSSNEQNDWVLSDDLSGIKKPVENAEVNNNLFNNLMRDYFDHYTKIWIAFINSLYINNANSLNEVTDHLNKLSGNTGEFQNVFKIIGNNTNTKLFEITDLKNLKSIHENSKILQDSFMQFSNITSLNSNKTLGDYYASLDLLNSEMTHIMMSANPYPLADQYAENILNDNDSHLALSLANNTAQQLIQGMQNNQLQNSLLHLLQEPIDITWKNILVLAKQNLQLQWQQNVLQEYQEKLMNKYPFDIQGDDADLISIQEMFSNNGVAIKYIDEKLKAYLSNNGNEWQAKTWLDLGVTFSPEYINAIENIKHIQNVLFSSDINNINMHILVQPIPTPGIDEISLFNNPNKLIYRNGPQLQHQFYITPYKLNDFSNVEINAQNHDGENSLSYAGYWSFLHLLDLAKINCHAQNNCTATWDIRLNDASYPIKINLQSNDLLGFELLLNHHFEMPSEL